MLLKVLEEVRHVLAHLDHLAVQVAIADPVDEVVHARVPVQPFHIELLRVTPCPSREVVVQHQGLLVALDLRDPPPSLDLPEIAPCLHTVPVVLCRKLRDQDLVRAAAAIAIFLPRPSTAFSPRTRLPS